MGSGGSLLRVSGTDRISGAPRVLSISSEEIGEVLRESLTLIADRLLRPWPRIPLELVDDIANRGVGLTGGGALVRDLEDSSSHDPPVRARTSAPRHSREPGRAPPKQGTSVLYRSRSLRRVLQGRPSVMRRATSSARRSSSGAPGPMAWSRSPVTTSSEGSPADG